MRNRHHSERQQQVETIIFGTTTPAGKAFDLCLLGIIVLSVTTVMLDSVAAFHAQHGQLFIRLEIAFTLLFTLEYLTRIWCASNR
ncbi:MAG: ion transporter, partial [Luminiphilus sp.]|nr:ion transporter [Luminiphilus sp.]